MPGWRIGYSAAPLEVTTAIKAVQGHVTSAANSIAQKAALEALSGPQDTVAVMCGEYARRRSRVAQLLQEIPGVRFSMPSGAFYFWVDVSAYLGKSHGGKRSTPPSILPTSCLSRHTPPSSPARHSICPAASASPTQTP